MRLLWSRAGQSQFCSCKPCTNVISHIAHRPAHRRKPTLAETFTACYSGIFAFSALADSKLKDARSRELDKAMDQALSELAILQEEREQLEKSQSRDYESRNKRTWAVKVNPKDVTVLEQPYYHPSSMFGALYALSNDTGRIYDAAPMDDPYTRISELRLGVELPHMTRQALRARARTNYESLENAIANTRNPRENPWYAQRKAQSRNTVTKADETLAECVDLMLHQVALGVYKNNGSPEASSANVPAWLRPVWDARAEGYPWHWWRHTNNRDLTRQLIQASYSVGHGSSHREYVAQVCYTLLTLRGEVEADKLNAIVLSMDRLGLHQVSKVLIGKFFHNFHLRPTPHSVVSFLNHYKVTDSPLRFYHLFKHMVGDCDEGYKVFRTKIEKFRRAPWWFVRRWHIRYSLVQYQDSILARVFITRPIANAIMEGLLYFEMVDHAVEFFVACLDDTVLVAPYLLGLLIDHCLASLNWKAALRLVQGLSVCPKDVAKLVVSSPMDEGLATRLDRLFDLCGLAQGGQPPQLHIDPYGLRHIRVAIWAKHLSMATGRSLSAEYYGDRRSSKAGFRAVGDAEWSLQAVHGLQIYGIEQQLNAMEESLWRLHQTFLSLALSLVLPRRTTYGRKRLRRHIIYLVAEDIERAGRRTRDLVLELRDSRINTVAGLVDNSERDLVPIQQRIYAVGGIAVLRRIQEAELYHVRLETELYRIHQTATSMRLRPGQIETAQLASEVILMVKAFQALRPRAKYTHGDCGRKTSQEKKQDGHAKEAFLALHHDASPSS